MHDEDENRHIGLPRAGIVARNREGEDADLDFLEAKEAVSVDGMNSFDAPEHSKSSGQCGGT